LYRYVPHDFSRADSESQFAIGLTDEYSLESGIAYTLDDGGVGTDECWRHKSQNRAAMSLICTVDENEHMVPIAVFISANAKTETLLRFWIGTYEKMVQRAKAITADPETISGRNRPPEVVEKIRVNAERIATAGWCIGKIMIDKHYPSLRAIRAFCKKYGLTVFIRLCQFHVVRAILNWEWGDGKKGISVQIPKSIKYEIVWLFRFVQRARTRAQFEILVQQFLKSLEQVLRSMFEAVKDYFERNWFVDDWIDTYTDIGLPPNQGRDGDWNTNNWTERAFKTFDSVILENRQNKRIDRLASHVLNDWLPYYQYWRPPNRPLDRELIELHHAAYTLWDWGAVRRLEPDRYGVDVIV
ncbi:hypothetical protein B0H14DRAFT_2334605, partial [Mycena olivaceomarginata]